MGFKALFGQRAEKLEAQIAEYEKVMQEVLDYIENWDYEFSIYHISDALEDVIHKHKEVKK